VSLLIDGYNVLFAFRGMTGGSWNEPVEKTRETLVALVSQYQHLIREKITLIFDGSRKQTQWPVRKVAGRMEILFTDPEETADSDIMARVEQSHHRSRLTVVSSDRAIKAYAQRRRVATQSAGAFVKKLLGRLERAEASHANREPSEKFHGLATGEVLYWKRFLKLDGDPSDDGSKKQ